MRPAKAVRAVRMKTAMQVRIISLPRRFLRNVMRRNISYIALFSPIDMTYCGDMTAQNASKSKVKSQKDAPHYAGHRERLKERFLKAGGDGLADYELLELLLTYAIPRKDVKPLAKALLQKYGTIAALCALPQKTLVQESGLGEHSAAFLKLLNALMVHAAREKTEKRNILGSRSALLEYLYAHMAHLDREEFRVIYLDNKNHILEDEVLFTGTVNASAVYPREIMKKALACGAVGLVLAHNHPSGHVAPSGKDEELTMHVQQLAMGLDIVLHDHIIVGKNSHFSFADSGKL